MGGSARHGHRPLPENRLTEVAARRAARGESRANLLPEEYGSATASSLWIGSGWAGSGAVLGGVYVIGVIIYFAALQVLNFRYSHVESQVDAVKTDYTNAVRSERAHRSPPEPAPSQIRRPGLFQGRLGKLAGRPGPRLVSILNAAKS